jgi:peptide deformylase
MATLPIRIIPDPVLKQVAAPVQDFDSGLHKLLDNMRSTMISAHGIGLAANQVGILQRIAVIGIDEHPQGCLDLVNPTIVSSSGRISTEEGCLSIPDYREYVPRYAEIEIQAQDREGKPYQLKADGLLAICLQHEIDHLDGILFIDRLSRLKRELFRRWWKKQQPS